MSMYVSLPLSSSCNRGGSVPASTSNARKTRSNSAGRTDCRAPHRAPGAGCRDIQLVGIVFHERMGVAVLRGPSRDELTEVVEGRLVAGAEVGKHAEIAPLGQVDGEALHLELGVQVEVVFAAGLDVVAVAAGPTLDEPTCHLRRDCRTCCRSRVRA